MNKKIEAVTMNAVQVCYEAPQVEIIEVQVENGFAVSDLSDYEDGGDL